MKLYIGVTDNDWFRFLRDLNPEEVNFWQPGGSQRFRALEPGEPFLFKLKAPYNHIAGGGFFVSHTFLPLTVAWETFGVKNGQPDYWSFAGKIHGYRSARGDSAPNPQIGCITLSQPFFFEDPLWIPAPSSWSANIVSGKTYDLRDPEIAALWSRIQDRLQATHAEAAPLVAESEPRYGSSFLTRSRLGQGAFRVLVTDAYERRCAITGERTLPVLQAAHIKPYARSGPNRTSNGLLLRADLHLLFDEGYLTVTPEHRVEVSRRIREEFENGRDYYALHGQRLKTLPARPEDRPGRTFIEYHNTAVFVP